MRAGFSKWLMVLLVLAAGALPAHAEVDPRRRTPVVEVFEQSRDGVVNIASTQILEVRSPFGFASPFDDGMDLFLGPRRYRGQVKRSSVGSGFVVHESGYIVTNAHVVAKTAERRAIFADGSEFDAEIVALDAAHDLAVLRIDPGNRPLAPLPMGTSSDLMVGETVVAIGNPLGFQHTVTSGVVSALDRALPVDRQTSLEGLIQTDASINPGNSGGPLLNVLGEVIGINTAIRADAQNIGFAIPVDRLRDLLPAMLDVERRFGIVTGLSVAEQRVGEALSVAITAIEPGSPAAEAGLRLLEGLAITAVNGEPLRGVVDYCVALMGRRPGDTLELTVRDGDGAERTVRLVLAERPQPDGAALLLQRLGMEAAAIDPAAAARAGVQRLRGLVITGLELNGPAARAGLETGDLIIQFGRHQPQTMDEVGELLDPLDTGDVLDVVILRVEGRVLYQAVARVTVR